MWCVLKVSTLVTNIPSTPQEMARQPDREEANIVRHSAFGSDVEHEQTPIAKLGFPEKKPNPILSATQLDSKVTCPISKILT